ncbi:T9SS type A sorting domain-containing protein [candidate division KSB1 bacterium]|nr:T9SS type A sorting domain-containing protein [candidate division KSB1 bacterium]
MNKLLLMLFALLILASSLGAQEAILQGDITANRTLKADSTYLLRGFVRVKAGATLTIPAGTILYGEFNTQGSLIVQPGGKIMAMGSVARPIIFTSQFSKPGSGQTPQRGDWGGVIILGNAPINVPGGTAAIEGPGDSYGGTNPDDNSGVLSYIRIEYAGIAFSPNNEINGLTFGGVGRGTQVDHIQVSYANDDSYEWFGGNVNCKYLIAYRGLDDDFDTDFGFQGKLQYLLGIRDPEIADVSGSNGFESDNDGSGSTNEPRTSPTWWNVTLIGPKATSSTAINSNYKRGMHLRRSSQNLINNALLMGWPTGLLIDGANTVADAQSGAMYVKNSILAAMATNFQSTDATFQAAMDSWFTTNGGRVFAENGEVLLADPFNLNNPNAMPATGSPVLTGGATPPNDGFFDTNGTHVGAFGKVDWTAGWSTFNYPVEGSVVLQGDITADRTLSADSTYLLRGFVRVKSGATLAIPAGTTIYGEYNTQGSLIVQPGGKIIAQGMVNKPIIFTSEFSRFGSSQLPQRGDWGGVILLGKAPINVPGGTAAIEGPGDSYGGNDPDDNSGVLSYVRIEYAGIAFSPNNEINGLTFGGVGRGTQVDHIQVSYANDDSFEWFGGTVNGKYLIAYRGLDDDFDTDFGYQGKLQFLLGVRDPEIADVSGSNGFESDNDGSGSTNTPRTSPTWWNVTLIGPKATSSTAINSNYKRSMHLRRSSQNKISNALLMGWPTGLLIDGANTVADAQAGAMYIKNSILAAMATNFQSTDATFQAAMDSWFTTNGGRVFADNSQVLLADAFNLNNPNAMPAKGSPVRIGGATPPNDGFFDTTADFVGAFGGTDWTAGWSTFNFQVPTSVGTEVSENIPTEFELSSNYPNPFNPTTTIQFGLPREAKVKLTVYNINGQEIATLVNDVRVAGTHKVQWDASNLPSGMYLYRLEAGSTVLNHKMMLLK